MVGRKVVRIVPAIVPVPIRDRHGQVATRFEQKTSFPKEGNWIGQVLKYLEAGNDIESSVMSDFSESIKLEFVDLRISWQPRSSDSCGLTVQLQTDDPVVPPGGIQEEPITAPSIKQVSAAGRELPQEFTLRGEELQAARVVSPSIRVNRRELFIEVSAGMLHGVRELEIARLARQKAVSCIKRSAGRLEVGSLAQGTVRPIEGLCCLG